MGLSVYTIEAVNKYKWVQMHTKDFPPKFYGRTSVIAHYDSFEEMSYKVFLSELKVSKIKYTCLQNKGNQDIFISQS